VRVCGLDSSDPGCERERRLLPSCDINSCIHNQQGRLISIHVTNGRLQAASSHRLISIKSNAKGNTRLFLPGLVHQEGTSLGEHNDVIKKTRVFVE
jgi:hypothetical protein